MRLNGSTKILSQHIVFVPYRIAHVPKYHEWMQSDELREQTASDKLTLEQEYDMQQTWLKDENKCTFIVLDKSASMADECESMIGDANLYLRIDNRGDYQPLTAEVGLMIAEKKYRGQGYGKEIASCIIRYGIEALQIKKFIAIISTKNETCATIFKKLTFVKESESEVFQEITFTRNVDDNFITFIKSNTKTYLVTTTEPNV